MPAWSVKHLLYFLLLHGLVIGAVALSYFASDQVKPFSSILVQLPWLLLGGAAWLGLNFNRSRTFVLALTLASLYMMQGYLLPELASGSRMAALSWLQLLLPALLLLLAVLPERPVFTLQNYMVLAVVAALFGWVQYGTETGAPWLEAVLHWTPVELLLPYPQSIVLTWAVAGAGLLLCLLWQRSASHNVLMSLWLVLGCFFFVPAQPMLNELLLVSGGAVLLIGVLQDSYNMAYRDELTGLLGRRALDERLTTLGRRYVIAMVDVDHFKKFNDRYGHDVGDQVLKMVASQLNKTSGGARAYRYGGEEFTLLFPGKSVQQAKPHLEAVREVIADYAMALRTDSRPKRSKDGKKQRRATDNKGVRKARAKTVGVTVSIGLAERNDKQRQPEQVIKAADKALYKAKNQGRNRLAL